MDDINCFCIGAQNGDPYCRCFMMLKGLPMNPPSPLHKILENVSRKTEEDAFGRKPWALNIDKSK